MRLNGVHVDYWRGFIVTHSIDYGRKLSRFQVQTLSASCSRGKNSHRIIKWKALKVCARSLSSSSDLKRRLRRGKVNCCQVAWLNTILHGSMHCAYRAKSFGRD